MKKTLKFFIFIIISIIILGITYFLSKWNEITVDKNIGKSIEIKNLDKKKFNHTYLIFDSTKVKTDFELFEIKNGTVSFNFDASKSSKYQSITSLRFNSGDGFSGVDIGVLKYKKKFFCYAESYTDNIGAFDFLKPEIYTIKKQKLTLNKIEYNKGDSIFGKIELEIKFKPNDSIYSAKGYFRGIVE